jgi:hypothetical protein
MGICKYCGRDAGFLRHVHAQCEAEHQDQLRKNAVADAEAARVYEAAIDEGARMVMSYADNQIDHTSLVAKLRDLEARKSIKPSEMYTVFIRGWEMAVDHFLANGIITVEQEARLSALQAETKLTQGQLNGHDAFMKVAKSSVLRSVLEGHRRTATIFEGFNFNLQKNEYLVWAFLGVDYLEARTHRQYGGGYGGFSIRIARGFYYHTGAFRSRPIDSTTLDPVDRGKLGITNLGIYFTGPVKTFRLPYKKIVAFEPFSDAVQIVKDTARAMPQVFSVDDPWFAFNLMKNLATIPS